MGNYKFHNRFSWISNLNVKIRAFIERTFASMPFQMQVHMKGKFHFSGSLPLVANLFFSFPKGTTIFPIVLLGSEVQNLVILLFNLLTKMGELGHSKL